MFHKNLDKAYYLLGDNMLKKVFNIIKRIIVSVLFIYAYNKLALPLDVTIPLNVFTVLLVSLFGVPTILMLVLFSVLFI